jgi:hypothetical protein
MSDGANRVDVLLDIPGNARAVATHAALQIDKVVGMADGADALGDRLALPSEALVLVASGCHSLCHLLQVRCRLWRTTWPALGRRVRGVVKALVHLLERCLGLGHGLCGGPLFDSHWCGDRFTQLMLHMAEVWRVMRPKVLGHIRQQSWSLIAGRLDHGALERSKGVLHARMPGVLITCLCGVLQQHIVPDWLKGYEAQTTCKGLILGHGDRCGGPLRRQTAGLLTLVRHHGFFNATVDLLLDPKGSTHKPIEAGHLQRQAHQANATRTDFDKHHM